MIGVQTHRARFSDKISQHITMIATQKRGQGKTAVFFASGGELRVRELSTRTQRPER
jgi:hypothetical protein